MIFIFFSVDLIIALMVSTYIIRLRLIRPGEIIGNGSCCSVFSVATIYDPRDRGTTVGGVRHWSTSSSSSSARSPCNNNNNDRNGLTDRRMEGH